MMLVGMGVLLRLWGFWWFSGIPLLAALASPFAKRKGREMACFVLLWVPASAGMTG